MSDFHTIQRTSLALRKLLADAFSSDPQMRVLIAGESDITLASPPVSKRDHSAKLTCWLYRVTESEHARNVPVGIAAPTTTRLNLQYLLTPHVGGDSDHVLLGMLMQCLRDRPVLMLSGSNAEDGGTAVITPNPLTLEEIACIWQALREPYQLSAAYTVHIDST